MKARLILGAALLATLVVARAVAGTTPTYAWRIRCGALPPRSSGSAH
jgi:hypothetical protein